MFQMGNFGVMSYIDLFGHADENVDKSTFFVSVFFIFLNGQEKPFLSTFLSASPPMASIRHFPNRPYTLHNSC